MPSYDEIEIARLIRLLPPAPESWADAAKQLPRTRRELERLLPLIERDAELREAMTRDLEGALREASIDPEPDVIAAFRRRLAAGDED